MVVPNADWFKNLEKTYNNHFLLYPSLHNLQTRGIFWFFLLLIFLKLPKSHHCLSASALSAWHPYTIHMHTCVYTPKHTHPHRHGTCSYSKTKEYRKYHRFWNTHRNSRLRSSTVSYRRTAVGIKCMADNSWPGAGHPESNPSSSLHACEVLGGYFISLTLTFLIHWILDEEITDSLSTQNPKKKNEFKDNNFDLQDKVSVLLYRIKMFYLMMLGSQSLTEKYACFPMPTARLQHFPHNGNISNIRRIH